MDIEEVKLLFQKRGYNLLSKDYKNNKQMLEFEKDGYVYVNSYNGFIKTDNFQKWSKKNPHSIANIKLWLSRNGYESVPVSTVFDYNDLKLRCNICSSIYSVRVNNLLRSHGNVCPTCSRKIGAEKHILVDKYQKVFEEYQLVLCEPYTGCKKYLSCIDKDGYKIKTSAYNLMQYNGAYKIFYITNPYTIENIIHYIDINKIDCELLSTQYKSYRSKLCFKCSCGSNFEKSLDCFMRMDFKCCKKCGIERGALIRKNKGGEECFKKYNITMLEEYTNMTTPTICEDQNGYKLKTSASALNHYNGAYQIFSSHNPYSLENIQKYLCLHNIDLEVISHTTNKSRKCLKFKCACGNLYDAHMADIQKGIRTSCPRCSPKRSQIEIMTQKWLDDNNIRYICEKRFDWCKDELSLPFDFYLPDYKAVIECQGEQHYCDKPYFGNFKYTQRHDKIKKESCYQHGMKYIELKYTLFYGTSYQDILSKHLFKK